jgi:putative transcriptional regulator
MTTAGKRLIQAAKEARAIARGEADAAAYVLHVTSAADVKGVRKKERLTRLTHRPAEPLPPSPRGKARIR